MGGAHSRVEASPTSPPYVAKQLMALLTPTRKFYYYIKQQNAQTI